MTNGGMMDLGVLDGTYYDGEETASVNIEVVYNVVDPNDPNDPNDPPIDPNDPWNPPNVTGNPLSGDFGKDTLFVQYDVNDFAKNETGAWALTYVDGASADLDETDRVYVFPANASRTTKIVSDRRPARGSRFATELTVDAVPTGSEDDFYFRWGFETKSREPVYFGELAQNKLVFGFPVDTSNNFAGKSLTVWQYDPLDPNRVFPVWGVKDLIAKRGGKLNLEPLVGAFASDVSCGYACVSTARPLGDVLRDGRIDCNDYALVEALQGFAGATDADVAGPGGLGLPDGVVNDLDLYYLYKALGPADAALIDPKPQRPGLVENFENGFGDLPWSFADWPQWRLVAGEGRDGSFAARAGAIGDDESTSLSVTLACIAGEICFSRKVSSEERWDFLEFAIDGREQGTWSGVLDWQEVAFPVEGGARTFTWTYRKDGSSCDGADTAWIDDIVFPSVTP